uniref:Uncharacterized protein n=1 Tax=viral metagenome TaxID=1070528 RepID=A0A6C0H1F8_9ZZZZ
MINIYNKMMKSLENENKQSVEIEKNKYIIINNINRFFDPFSLIQTKKNILYNNGRSSLLADLLFKIMDNYSEDINLNSIFSHIIEKKLLFDSDMDGNQPVFNIINNNGYSLLSKYLEIIRNNESNDIFKYFYNKELLIVQPTPLCIYIKNKELFNNNFYDPKIIALLSINYNDQNPLLIKDNNYSIYPIELLLKIIYEQENVSNVLNFLNSDDFYKIMNLMMYNYEESFIDEILGLLKKIYDKYELLYKENVNQENKKRIFELIKNYKNFFIRNKYMLNDFNYKEK